MSPRRLPRMPMVARGDWSSTPWGFCSAILPVTRRKVPWAILKQQGRTVGVVALIDVGIEIDARIGALGENGLVVEKHLRRCRSRTW